jgi:hypothetical protein
MVETNSDEIVTRQDCLTDMWICITCDHMDIDCVCITCDHMDIDCVCITCEHMNIDCVWQGIIWLARVVTRIRQLTVRYHQVTPTQDLKKSRDHFSHISFSFLQNFDFVVL